MTLPKDGTNQLPKAGFDWMAVNVIFQGRKGLNLPLFSNFHTYCPCIYSKSVIGSHLFTIYIGTISLPQDIRPWITFQGQIKVTRLSKYCISHKWSLLSNFAWNTNIVNHIWSFSLPHDIWPWGIERSNQSHWAVYHVLCIIRQRSCQAARPLVVLHNFGMTLPKDGTNQLPKAGFDWMAVNVIFQGRKGLNLPLFSNFHTYCPCIYSKSVIGSHLFTIYIGTISLPQDIRPWITFQGQIKVTRLSKYCISHKCIIRQRSCPGREASCLFCINKHGVPKPCLNPGWCPFHFSQNIYTKENIIASQFKTIPAAQKYPEWTDWPVRRCCLALCGLLYHRTKCSVIIWF